MNRILSILVLVLALAVSGCAGNASFRDLAPTPPESTLIAHQVMRLAITSKDLDVVKLAEIRLVMLDAQRVLLAAMKEGEDIEVARVEYLAEKHPEVGSLVNTVLAIVTFRLRHLIDQGKTEEAATYIEAVIGGAVDAIDEVSPSAVE